MEEEVAGASGACCRDGQPAELDGEDEDEDGAESEVGEREADEGDDAEGAVLPAVAMERGADAGGDGGGDADEERGEGEGEGVGVALQDEVSDGVVQAEGLAEVGVEDSVPVVGVLLCERSVEAVGVAEGVDVGGGGAFAEHLDDGVAGDEMDEEEDDGDDDPEDGECEEDAAERASSRAALRLRGSRRDAGFLRFDSRCSLSRNDTLVSWPELIGSLPCSLPRRGRSRWGSRQVRR